MALPIRVAMGEGAGIERIPEFERGVGIGTQQSLESHGQVVYSMMNGRAFLSCVFIAEAPMGIAALTLSVNEMGCVKLRDLRIQRIKPESDQWLEIGYPAMFYVHKGDLDERVAEKQSCMRDGEDVVPVVQEFIANANTPLTKVAASDGSGSAKLSVTMDSEGQLYVEEKRLVRYEIGRALYAITRVRGTERVEKPPRELARELAISQLLRQNNIILDNSRGM